VIVSSSYRGKKKKKEGGRKKKSGRRERFPICFGGQAKVREKRKKEGEGKVVRKKWRPGFVDLPSCLFFAWVEREKKKKKKKKRTWEEKEGGEKALPVFGRNGFAGN